MLDPDAARILSHLEPPARLARADVVDLRRLYTKAMSRKPTHKPKQGGWRQGVGRAVIFLSRDKPTRAVGRLGRPLPAVTVTAEWYHMICWGLNVKVVAHTRLGGEHDQPGRRDTQLLVGEHRFTSATSQTQFCRECSRLVRHGLAWTEDRMKLLHEIL